MDLETLGLISLIAVLLFMLVKSADLVEDSFVFLARRIGISEFFIGFVILGAMSSLPEFSIAINANHTIPELSIANLFGATLILMTLIIGLYAIKFNGLDFVGKFGELEIIWGLSVVFISVLTVVDRNLNWIDGIILVAAYASYLFHIYDRFKEQKQSITLNTEMLSARRILAMLGKSVFGIIAILVSSSLIVDTVVELGNRASIDSAFIGLFVLGIGTNIPELTILLRAKDSSKQKLAIGNIIGSASVNVFTLGVLGILGQDIQITEFDKIVPVLVTLTLATFMFSLFSWTGRKLTKNEGITLIGVYTLLLTFETVLVFANFV